MLWRPTRRIVLALATLGMATGVVRAQGPDGLSLEALKEQAIKAAVHRVAPSIVQIETLGGAEVINPTNPRGAIVRKGTGPTTGLVVSADGYLITSAFNFANKPQQIFVSIPGHKERYVAQVHATDHSRMLTLLKLENFQGALPVPAVAPRKDFAIGQSAIALGRTLDPNPDHAPSVSVGILSALNRVWGRAVQTDAKVSPTNYGGPLVDLHGRIIGVLVPASPLSEDETAGVEWYDGGIGFAIPLEDINAVLPRLMKKEDLNRGLLGITAKTGDLYSTAPVVNTIAPDSAAEKAGMKPGDTILEIDGHPVSRQAQVMHLLGPKYSGDVVAVKVKHSDGKEETFKDLKLTASLKAQALAYLGILPLRDDPELGVEVRYVFPKSPAAAAGIKEGDRITKVGPAGGTLLPFSGRVSGREQLASLLGSLPPRTQMQLELKRKDGGKTEVVSATLDVMPGDVPDKLPDASSAKKAQEPLKTGPAQPPAAPGQRRGGQEQPAPGQRRGRVEQPPDDKKEEKKDEKKDEKLETGFFERKDAAGEHTYWVYVPEGERYDPNVSCTLLIWLHPVGKGKDRDLKEIADFWQEFCDRHHIVLLCPRSENETGWAASEADFIRETAKTIMEQYTIDKRRVIVHGMGSGGQMAYYLAFHLRDLLRGVATTGAALANQPKPVAPSQPLSFFIATGVKDPIAPDVRDGKAKLEQLKYPVVYREIAEMGHQYLSDPAAEETLGELIRWIDSIDRL